VLAFFEKNGKTYDSLSKVAFAINGTNWNGPRFFGLRDKISSELRSAHVSKKFALLKSR
jgi:hypothetical protein